MALDWGREQATWPNAEASRFVDTRAHRWHVQDAGTGPTILLLHGVGGATHSWRDLFPALTDTARVIAPDLPGHGFTRPKVSGRAGLPHMAEDTASLLNALSADPDILVGHSAGAAIALEMVRAGLIDPRRVIALNGALTPFRGVARTLFPAMARLLALNPLSAPLFARTASATMGARQLIASTGSQLDAAGLGLYGRVIGDHTHVEGALRMMASWELTALARALPALSVPVTFVLAGRDRTIPPAEPRRAAEAMPAAEILEFPDYGHLLHEEVPDTVAALIRDRLP